MIKYYFITFISSFLTILILQIRFYFKCLKRGNSYGLKEPLLNDKVYILLNRDLLLLCLSALGLALTWNELLNNILLTTALTLFMIFLIYNVFKYYTRIKRKNYYLLKDWYSRGTITNDEEKTQIDYLENAETITVVFKNGNKFTFKRLD